MCLDFKKTLYFKTKDSKFESQLAAGQYELQIRSFDKRNVPGQWSEPIEYNIFEKPIKNLKQKHTVTAKNTKKTKVRFSWQRPENKPEVQFSIELQSGKKITKKLSADSITLTLPVARSYKWLVESMTPKALIKDSSSTPMEFQEFDIIGPKLKAPKPRNLKSSLSKRLVWKKDQI